MPIIDAHDLRKTYRSRSREVHALDGLTLAVPQGSVTGLLGPNGAGKTTAVKVLTTLIRPDSGSARVAGFDVLTHPQQVRRIIGSSGQYAAVDENLTGLEKVPETDGGLVFELTMHGSWMVQSIKGEALPT